MRTRSREASAGSRHHRARTTWGALLRETADLDIYDLNYAAGSERLGRCHQSQLVPRWSGSLASLARFVAGFVATAVWMLRSRRRPARLQAAAASTGSTPVVAAVATVNQRRAIEPVLEHLTDARIVGIARASGLGGFPLLTPYLVALGLAQQSLRRRSAARGYQALSWRYFGHQHVLVPGFYVVARRWLEAERPPCVIVSNDHSMPPRTFAAAAAASGVTTVYLQHASVTTNFPPLDYDLAFLDGRDALDKYLAVGPVRGDIYLLGSPLHDALIERGHRHARTGAVGICLNVLDDEATVVALVAALTPAVGGARLRVRVHQADGRDWSSLLAGVELESVAERPLVDFLDDVDVVLAGSTNVHLEAAVYGLPSTTFDPVAADQDVYGFIAGELIPAQRSPEAAARWAAARLHDPEPLRVAAVSHYNATVGTPHAGRSAALIAAVIEHAVTGAERGTPVALKTRRVGDALVHEPVDGVPSA